MLPGMLLCPALSSATPSVVNDQQKKAIVADNAALLAENGTLRETVSEDHALARQMILSFNAAVSADAAVISQQQAIMFTLQEQLKIKDKIRDADMKAERARGWVKAGVLGTLGLIIGLVSK